MRPQSRQYAENPPWRFARCRHDRQTCCDQNGEGLGPAGLLDRNSALFVGTFGLISQALADLVRAAVVDGTIRADVDVADILETLSGIYAVPAAPDWQ